MRTLLARERRAQTEVPVVMIFAVVAGVLVLLLVGWFAIKQQQAAEHARDLKQLKNIATAIEAASNTVDAKQTLILTQELRVECNNEVIELVYGKARRPLPGVALFGPQSLRGVVSVTSASIGSAYRVGNVVYLNDTKTTATGAPTGFTTHPGAGKISWTSSPPPSDSHYFDSAFERAAKISSSKETFECGVSEAIKRYRLINNIQHRRVQAIVKNYTAANNHVCKGLYREDVFTRIETTLTTDSSLTKKAKDLIETEVKAIVEIENEIKQMNENLVRMSCATAS